MVCRNNETLSWPRTDSITDSRMTSDSIEDDRSSASTTSIEDFGEGLEAGLDDISNNEDHCLDDIAPSEHIPPAVQSIVQGDLRVRSDTMPDIVEEKSSEGSTEEPMSNESDRRAATPATPIVELGIVSVDDESISNEIENSPVLIQRAGSSGDELELNAVETVPCDPGRKVSDKEWVLEAAAALMQKGISGEWKEIIETWVLLQRNWDRIEVRHFLLTEIERAPDKHHLGNRPIAEAN